MSTKKTTLLGALIVLAFSAGYFLSYARYGLAYDEGYLLDGVEKIMEGQVIYRDFHHTYAPGRFYLLAAAFKAFGKNIMVERFIFALLQAIKCLLAFLIARRLGARKFALLAPILICIAPGPWHKVFFSGFGFLAIYAVLVMLDRAWMWSLACGLVIGVSGVFRQDAAGFAAVGGLLAMAFATVVGSLSKREFAKRALGMLAGIAIVALPVLGYFESQQALGAMIQKVTREGMLDNLTNRIPYPSLWTAKTLDGTYFRLILANKILFYLPFAAYVLAVAIIVRNLKRPRASVLPGVVVLAAAVLAFNQSIWRSDVGHLLQTLQFAFLLVPLIAEQIYDWLAQRMAGKSFRVVVFIILFALLPSIVFWASYGCYVATTSRYVAMRFLQEGISVGDTEYVGSMLVRCGNDTKLGLQRAPIFLRADEAAFFMAIKRFLDAHTSPGDYVLAVPQLQLVYFFYDRRNPTRYAHYRRALAPEEEERYINDIESHGTEYVLLVEPFEGARIGATRQPFSQYAHRVRSWICSNYVEIERIGPVRILHRKT